MATLPQNWKSWVLDSLLQGSEAMEILKILLQNGFTFEAATKALGTNLPEGVKCNKDTQFYERVAKPKLFDHLDQYQCEVIMPDKIQMIKIDNFLDEKECIDLITLTKSKLRPSEIPARKGDYYDGFRTSSTCDLPFTKDPLAKIIDAKIVDALGLGVGEKEVIQAQHYAVGQQFKAHYDYFVPGSEDFKTYSKDGGQRTWTFMIYLNEECEGGQTEFVKLKKAFTPKTGTALVWNNLHPDGMPNENTLHHAHPIIYGEKTVITKWFREDSYKTG